MSLRGLVGLLYFGLRAIRPTEHKQTYSLSFVLATRRAPVLARNNHALKLIRRQLFGQSVWFRRGRKRGQKP